MAGKALITGQDGVHLAEFLLSKGYTVHGVKRRASSFNTDRIYHPYQRPREKSELVAEMVSSDMELAKCDAMIAKEGYEVYSRHE